MIASQTAQVIAGQPTIVIADHSTQEFATKIDHVIAGKQTTVIADQNTEEFALQTSHVIVGQQAKVIADSKTEEIASKTGHVRASQSSLIIVGQTKQAIGEKTPAVTTPTAAIRTGRLKAGQSQVEDSCHQGRSAADQALLSLEGAGRSYQTVAKGLSAGEGACSRPNSLDKYRHGQLDDKQSGHLVDRQQCHLADNHPGQLVDTQSHQLPDREADHLYKKRSCHLADRPPSHLADKQPGHLADRLTDHQAARRPCQLFEMKAGQQVSGQVVDSRLSQVVAASRSELRVTSSLLPAPADPSPLVTSPGTKKKRQAPKPPQAGFLKEFLRIITLFNGLIDNYSFIAKQDDTVPIVPVQQHLATGNGSHLVSNTTIVK